MNKITVAPPIKIDLRVCKRSKRKKFNKKYMYNNPFENEKFEFPDSCKKPEHYTFNRNFNCSKITKEDAVLFRNELYATNKVADQSKILDQYVSFNNIHKRRNVTVNVPKILSFLYFLPTKKGRVCVCKNMFMATTGTTKSRLDKVQANIIKRNILKEGDIDDLTQLSEESKKILIARKEKVLRLEKGTFEEFSKAIKERANQKETEIETEDLSSSENYFSVHEDEYQLGFQEIDQLIIEDVEDAENFGYIDIEACDVCRICLSNDGLLFDAHERQFGESHTTAEMVEYALSCKLKPNDNLPDKICEFCLEKVKIACSLKASWIESERVVANTIEMCKSYQDIENSNAETIISDLYSQDKLLNELPIGDIFEIDENDLIEELEETEYNEMEPNRKIIKLQSSGKIRESKGRWDSIDPSEITAVKCYLCDNFNFEVTMEEHFEKFHNDYEMKQCTFCDFRTEYPFYMNLHYQVHADDFRICAFCNQKIPRTQFFSHKRSCMPMALRKPKVHTRYKCRYCEKNYSTSSFRNTHEKIHTKEKLHQCKHCDQSFYKPILLRQHLLTKHGEETDFRCPICNKCFVLNYRLLKHYGVCSQKNKVN